MLIITQTIPPPSTSVLFLSNSSLKPDFKSPKSERNGFVKFKAPLILPQGSQCR